MSGILKDVPDVGMTKKTPRTAEGKTEWRVDISVYSMTPEEARSLAFEILGLADKVAEMNDALGAQARADGEAAVQAEKMARQFDRAVEIAETWHGKATTEGGAQP